MDNLHPTERSRRMSLIRGKNTAPEMIVRRLVHSLGFRYRLHRRELPGVPDLVFPKLKKAIFVHGCFWHRHDDSNCKLARLPKSRLDFWVPKLERNRNRDIANQEKLFAMGWAMLIIWECQLSDRSALIQTVKEFLSR